MDLIGQEERKQEVKGKKIVLWSLIASVLLLTILIVMIVVLASAPKDMPFRLFIDDEQLVLSEGLIVTDDEGKMYISLKDIANRIEDFTYYSGEYLKYAEDIDYCYLENDFEIVGFEVNSTTIYKTSPNSVVDYQHYELSEKIISSNDKTYILIDDLRISM